MTGKSSEPCVAEDEVHLVGKSADYRAKPDHTKMRFAEATTDPSLGRAVAAPAGDIE
jgi:hypothetical protein